MEDSHLGAGARLSVIWQAGVAEHPVATVDHIASYAKALVEALSLAGWQPRRIEVALRVLEPRVVEIDVRGDVPRLDQSSFAKLASVAIATCNLWATLEPDAEIRLRPRLFQAEPTVLAAEPAPPTPAVARTSRTALEHVEVAALAPSLPAPEPPLAPPPSGAPARVSPKPAPAAAAEKPRLATRVVIALLFGGLLGLFGLPRLTPQFGLPTLLPAAQSLPTPLPTLPPPALVSQLTLLEEEPTFEPTPAATSTPRVIQPVVVVPPTPQPSRVLFAERFIGPLPGWPHDLGGKAWFADGTYQLVARDPGRFVAISAPVGGGISDVVMTARFRKTGGPPGGGYGLVVRNQGATSLDGENQLGRYLVLEVGDMGDIGIWQREEARWVDVMPWTHSNAVKVGSAPNELVVTTQGRQLRFAVNGVEVANFTHDGLPPDGGVGIFVGGDLNEVSLEWLIVEAADTLAAR